MFDSISNGLVSLRGVEGDGQNITVTLDAANRAAKITLTPGSQAVQYFANAAARAAATPGFVGQIGIQVDTQSAYLGTATSAGSWKNYFGMLGNAFDQPMQGSTTIVTDAVDFFQYTFQLEDASASASFGNNSGFFSVFTGGVELNGNTTSQSGNILFVLGPSSGFTAQSTSNTLSVSESGSIALSGTTIVSGGFNLTSGANLNFLTGSGIELNGTHVAANSVLITTASPGTPSSALINTFLSSANVQTGYSLTSSATLRAFDATTVGVSYSQTVLTNLANFVLTLAADLEALKVPHA